MRNKKALIVNIVYIILGICLIVLTNIGVIPDEDSLYQGMGGGILVVGIINSIRHFFYKTNKEYKKNVDIKMSDERNIAIAKESWYQTSRISIFLLCILEIILAILGYKTLLSIIGMIIGFELVLFYILYLVNQRKM